MRTLIAVAVGLLLGVPVSAIAGGIEPDYQRIRNGLKRTPGPSIFIVTKWPGNPISRSAVAPPQRAAPAGRDSIWNGLLIGGAIGGASGYVWAHNICGRNDSECFVIAAPVGMLGGAGIGAAIGAVADALHK